MPHRRFEWHERIKAVEREYWSARRAVDRLSADVARDPSTLGEGPSPRDLRSADENLEGTYLVRMFAEFETGVRSFWRAIKPRARAQAEVLLDRVGDRCKIPADVIRLAHSTRTSLGVRLCFWFFIPVEKPRTKSDPLAESLTPDESL